MGAANRTMIREIVEDARFVFGKGHQMAVKADIEAAEARLRSINEMNADLAGQVEALKASRNLSPAELKKLQLPPKGFDTLGEVNRMIQEMEETANSPFEAKKQTDAEALAHAYEVDPDLEVIGAIIDDPKLNAMMLNPKLHPVLKRALEVDADSLKKELEDDPEAQEIMDSIHSVVARIRAEQKFRKQGK
jgi:hypothetical protein